LLQLHITVEKRENFLCTFLSGTIRKHLCENLYFLQIFHQTLTLFFSFCENGTILTSGVDFFARIQNSLLADIPKHGIGEGPVVVVIGQLFGPPTVVLLPTPANFPTGPRLSLQKNPQNSVAFVLLASVSFRQDKHKFCAVFSSELRD
jgi:hypothetical protein